MPSPSRFLSLLLLAVAIGAGAQGPAFPYSVALSWTLSTSTITGQNVYRAPYTAGVCGTFAKLTTTAALSATVVSFSDSTVSPNQAYCYATTALSGTQESGFSNVVSNMQIPPAPDTNVTGTVN